VAKITETTVIKRRNSTSSVVNYLYIASSVLAILVFLYLFFISGFFGVSNIKITGDDVITEQEAHADIKDILEQRYFLFFEKGDNSLFINEQTVESTLKQKHRIIESVEVKKGIFGGLTLNLTKANPVLIFKSGEEYITVSNEGFKLGTVSREEAQKMDIPIMIAEGEIAETSTKNLIIDTDLVDFNIKFSREIKSLTNYSVVDVHINLGQKGKIIDFVLNTGTRIKAYIELNPDYMIDQFINSLDRLNIEYTEEVGIYFKESIYIRCKSGQACIK
jgi:cell division septal protein FtsQ